MADQPPDDAGPFDRLGYPKPAQNPPSKRLMREAAIRVVMPHLAEILEAQIKKAKGVKHLVGRNESGQFKKITPDQLDDFEHIEVWERDPDVSAIVDILNRCLDKPKEQAQELIVSDGDKVRERINALRPKRGE